jgi:hypothetical protein
MEPPLEPPAATAATADHELRHDWGSAPGPRVLGPAAPDCDDADDWAVYWHDALWAMWTAVQDVRAGYGVLDRATFDDFADFAYGLSSSLPEPERRAP